jgi:DNA gyrase/topoisomerase IV subunit B
MVKASDLISDKFARKAQNEIQVLSGIEGIRQCVGMYLGASETQVMQTLRETVQNAETLI